MAVFLHFGKEISDMMVKHISIEVTSKQTKKPVFGGPAVSFPALPPKPHTTIPHPRTRPDSAGREQPVAFTGFKKGRSKCGGAFVSGGASWDRAWDRRNPGNRSEISGALL